MLILDENPNKYVNEIFLSPQSKKKGIAKSILSENEFIFHCFFCVYSWNLCKGRYIGFK